MFKIWSIGSQESVFLLWPLSFYLVSGFTIVLELVEAPEHYLLKLSELTLSSDWLMSRSG
jgi:hypothetical protein